MEFVQRHYHFDVSVCESLNSLGLHRFLLLLDSYHNHYMSCCRVVSVIFELLGLYSPICTFAHVSLDCNHRSCKFCSWILVFVSRIVWCLAFILLSFGLKLIIGMS